MEPQPAAHRPRVVVVGAGFGGLETVKGLAGAPVDITFIDRRNHHLFQPLLYQVATASLATSEIAWPIRSLVRDRKEVTTLLATVTGVDVEGRRVLLENGQAVAYDILVLATGARHAYFGHDEWEPFALGLKTIEDATTLRRRILVAFEQAERETDPERQAALLTFVIVGAGPTGVEMAGTIAELAHDTLSREFRNIDPGKARVLIVEAAGGSLAAIRTTWPTTPCAPCRTSGSRSSSAARSPTAPPGPSPSATGGSPPARSSGPPASAPPRRRSGWGRPPTGPGG